MRIYGKNRKKAYMHRYLFVMDNNIISLRLENKRSRQRVINKYFNEGLKQWI